MPVLSTPNGRVSVEVENSTITITGPVGEPLIFTVTDSGALRQGEVSSMGPASVRTGDAIADAIAQGDTKPGEGPQVPGVDTAPIESRKDGMPTHGATGQASHETAQEEATRLGKAKEATAAKQADKAKS